MIKKSLKSRYSSAVGSGIVPKGKVFSGIKLTLAALMALTLGFGANSAQAEENHVMPNSVRHLSTDEISITAENTFSPLIKGREPNYLVSSSELSNLREGISTNSTNTLTRFSDTQTTVLVSKNNPLPLTKGEGQVTGFAAEVNAISSPDGEDKGGVIISSADRKEHTPSVLRTPSPT